MLEGEIDKIIRDLENMKFLEVLIGDRFPPKVTIATFSKNIWSWLPITPSSFPEGYISDPMKRAGNFHVGSMLQVAHHLQRHFKKGIGDGPPS